jgi:metallopeptidase MepB
MTALGFYNQVSTSKELREAADTFEKKLGDYMTDFWMREDLYKVIKEYHTNAVSDGSFKKLDKESQRFVNKLLEDFETNGMKLSLPDREKVKNLDKEISELEQKASKNIADSDE